MCNYINFQDVSYSRFNNKNGENIEKSSSKKNPEMKGGTDKNT